METAESNRTWVEVKAIKAVEFPVTLWDVKVDRTYTEADIFKNDLPQLQSHKSMKTSGILLNFKNDSYQILGKYTKLQRTTSGHYSLLLTNMLLGSEKSPKIVLHCYIPGFRKMF